MASLPVFFRAAAFSNWLLGISTLFLRAQSMALELPAPRYPALAIFTGTLLMVLGMLYWQIAELEDHRKVLLELGVLSKGAGALIWTMGLLTGELPPVFLIYAIWSDLLWLPGFIYYYLKLK